MKQQLLKTMLLLFALTAGLGNTWAKEGDEITSISDIVDGKSYYIKGVRSSSTYYLKFTDAEGSQDGTESETTAGAQLITFHKKSENTYQLETSSGNFIAPGTKNGKINVSKTGIDVTVSDQSSTIRLSITSGSTTWSIQKNTSAANFGGYKNTQKDITLIEGPAAYSITAVSSNASYGTVTLEGKVITGSPNSGYRYASPAYTVSSGTATVSQDGNEFTVTPSSDCTVQINFEAIPTHTVTVTGTDGTVTIKDGDNIVASGSSVCEGTVLTINAIAGVGKVFSGWNLTGATPAGQEATTTFTVGESNVTIEALYDDATTHAITYSVNGNTTTANVVEGEDVDLSAPASGVPTGYAFMGWRTSTLAVTDTDPDDYVTSATSTADITYYAVMAKVISSTPESWTETALSSLTSSDIFVFSDGFYAMKNDGGTSNAPTANEITVIGTEITSTVGDNLKWNVTGNATDGYTFYPNGTTETWLYCNTTASSSSNNNIRVGTGDRKVWELNGSGYLVTKDNYTARYLSIYNSQDFRGYINTNNNAFIPKFYKYIASVNIYAGYCTTIPPVSVTVSDAGYATLASDYALDFTDSSIKAYIAKGKADHSGVTFEQINKVPANTGVLLYCDGGATEDIPVFAGAADATTGNVFVRGEGDAVASVDANLHNYILNKVGSVVGFYKAAGKTVATNRAYIQIDESTAYSIKGFICLPGYDEDGADGIGAVRPEAGVADGPVFDLQGRRVQNPDKGLYIVNGKKVMY